jgi:hypothetical protein
LNFKVVSPKRMTSLSLKPTLATGSADSLTKVPLVGKNEFSVAVADVGVLAGYSGITELDLDFSTGSGAKRILALAQAEVFALLASIHRDEPTNDR